MEVTHGARVDGQAIVLVLDNGFADGHTVTLTNIKAIGVVATVAVAVRVANGDTVQDNVVGLDAESLHGGVLDIEAGDSRVIKVVGVEELGLGLSAVGALAVPPARTAAVDGVVGCSTNDDVGSGDTDERAIPLLVSEGGLAVEYHL